MMVARGYSASAQLVFINDPWPPNTGDVRWITYANYVSQPKDHTHWTDYFEIRYTRPGSVPGAGLREETMSQESAQPPRDDPQAAAQDALKLFAELVTPETAEAMGFREVPVDPATLSLGEPFPMYSISYESLQSSEPGAAAGPMLTDMEEMFYPVYSNDQVVSSVTVANRDGRWVFISLGNTNLAKDLVDTRNRNAAPMGLSPSAYSIVNVPALYMMFVAHRDNEGKLELTHIHDNDEYGFKRDTTESGQNVLNMVQSRVSRPGVRAEAPDVIPYFRR